MTKFEEEFNYLIELSGKVLIGQVDAEVFEKNRVSFFEKYETDQQQALPVVPSFVAEWIECVKGKSKNALALLDDDDMPDDMNEWLFFQRSDDNINLILRAWLEGYTVEKPQLFYLKHIDMSKADKECDWYLITDCVKLCHEWVGKNLKPKDDDFKFTQSEIDSMETGSYEQIEVTE
ncbi:DUF1642 domain-containing protein [Lactococcus lactis]